MTSDAERSRRGGPAPGGRSTPGAALTGVLLAGAVATAAAACGTGVFVPDGPGPLVYVVLGQTVSVDGRPVQRAFLLDADNVRPSYRSAARFEITRVADGETFRWRERGLAGASPFVSGELGVPVEEGNFQLVSPRAPDGSLAALRPGEAYRLRIETRGRTVTGTATIPGRFDVAVVDSAGRRVLVWPSVEGAGAYVVTAPLERFPLGGIDAFQELTALRRDTTAVVPDFLESGTRIRVRALDANLVGALEGESLQQGSAGLDGGRGVFGAQRAVALTL